MSMAAAEKRIVEVLILMNSGLDGWMDGWIDRGWVVLVISNDAIVGLVLSCRGAVRCCCFSRRFLAFQVEGVLPHNQ